MYIEPQALEKRFGALIGESLSPRYNAAPSQRLPVVEIRDSRRIVFAQWGLIPPWVKHPRAGDGIINVRAETLREKRTFEADFLHRRCLVLADGFYEWKKLPSGKKGSILNSV